MVFDYLPSELVEGQVKGFKVLPTKDKKTIGENLVKYLLCECMGDKMVMFA